MSADLFAEAVDTAVTLGWALIAWIVLCGIFAGLALCTVAVGVRATVRGLGRGVAAARRGLRASVAAEQFHSDPEPGTASHAPAQSRTPAWARTELIKET